MSEHPGWARAKAAQAEQELEQVKLNRQISKNREQAKEAYDASEQGAVHREIERADKIMHMPSPEAVLASGGVPGDPTRGPSS